MDRGYSEHEWRGKTWKTHFVDLCEALGELGIWVRMHYVYPYLFFYNFFPILRYLKILIYFYIHLKIPRKIFLKNITRPGNQIKTLDRIKEWKKIVPDLTVRSTFIVGFPGETEDDFKFLLDWLQEAELGRAGCFKYEDVKGAKSHILENHVPEDIKEARWHQFMQTQQEISTRLLAKKVDTIQDIIIDNIDEENNLIGRSKGDAPDIDGLAILDPNSKVKIGDIVKAKIYDSDEYDLFGEVV